DGFDSSGSLHNSALRLDAGQWHLDREQVFRLQSVASLRCARRTKTHLGVKRGHAADKSHVLRQESRLVERKRRELARDVTAVELRRNRRDRTLPGRQLPHDDL